MTDLKPEDRALIERLFGPQWLRRGQGTVTTGGLSLLLDAARAEGLCSPSGGDEAAYKRGWSDCENEFLGRAADILPEGSVALTGSVTDDLCGSRDEPTVGATAALAPNVAWTGRGDYEPTEAMIEAGEWHNHRHNGQDNMIASFKAMMVQAEIEGLVRPFDGGEAVHARPLSAASAEPKDGLSGPTGEVGGVEPVAWRYRFLDRMDGSLSEWDATTSRDAAFALAGPHGKVEPLFAAPPCRDPQND